MTKTVHTFTAQKNYTSSARDKSKFRVSIAHSLRCISNMPTDTLDKIQWDDSLSYLNMFFKDGQVTPLNELTENQKIALIEELIKPSISNKRKKQTARANYAKKMRNAIKSESAHGNTATSEALTTLLNTAPSTLIDSSVTEQFTDAFRTRTKQRINMMKRFIDAHNALINDERCGSHTRYQEVIFKIPEKWEISAQQLTAENQFHLVKNFLKHLLPNHPILFATTHADENISEGHCAHIHVFVDGKNAVTGQFDLRKSELEALDRYVNEHNIDVEDWNKKKTKSTYAHSHERGKIWQKMFLNATNAYFIYQEIPIKAERALQTEEYKEQLSEMRRQSKKRKTERSYNFHTLAEERKKKLEKELSALEQKISDGQKQLDLFSYATATKDNLIEEISMLERHHSSINSKIKQSATDIKQQQQVLEQSKRQSKQLENEISTLNKAKEQLKESIEAAQPELLKIDDQLEYLETAQSLASNDTSLHPVVVVNSMVSEYYKSIREKKPENTALFERIITAFKQLMNKFQRKFVMDKVYDLSREAGCKKLAKELHFINKNPPEKGLSKNSDFSLDFDH